MGQGTGEQQSVSGDLLDAVVAPVSTIAFVRDEKSGDVTVLSLLDTECKPLVLSGSAAVIWDELDGVRSVQNIVTELAADYELDEVVIGEQVLAFVSQLLETQLVRTVDLPQGSA